MALWIVSGVQSHHASRFALPVARHRQVSIADELHLDSTSESDSSVGVRLFWASILAVVAGIVLPTIVARALQTAPHPAPETIARAPIVAERAPSSTVLSSRALPKAQPPPADLLPQ
jgi:hypothetical protein